MTVISRRASIIDAVVLRLAEIQLQHDYYTDAGDAIYVNESPQLGSDDPNEAIAVMVGEDEPRIAGPGLLITLPIAVHALARADLEDRWTRVEKLLADIKAALELEDRRFDGLLTGDLERGSTVTLERSEHSLAIGVAVNYRAQYKEAWGGA